MLDPFRATLPEAVHALFASFADRLCLWALPLHAHEVLFALSLYTCLDQVISPAISTRLFPHIYPSLSPRTKISWNTHVVSFVQSCIVTTLSFYVIFFDEERKAWRQEENWDKRVWGYTGLTGLLQSLALGYFLWDLYISVRYVHITGWGMVAHAIASSAMFTFGFRPFIHFYCPVFLLHELSTPFLNIHWFCDKVNLTGSRYQAINGAILTVTFFCCRIVWGAYGSIGVSRDVYRATFTGYTLLQKLDDNVAPILSYSALEDPLGQTTLFMKTQRLPLWLGASYLVANIALAFLNVFWFSKMVQTIRKRFNPPFGTKAAGRSGSSSLKDQ